MATSPPNDPAKQAQGLRVPANTPQHGRRAHFMDRCLGWLTKAPRDSPAHPPQPEPAATVGRRFGQSRALSHADEDMKKGDTPVAPEDMKEQDEEKDGNRTPTSTGLARTAWRPEQAPLATPTPAGHPQRQNEPQILSQAWHPGWPTGRGTVLPWAVPEARFAGWVPEG